MAVHQELIHFKESKIISCLKSTKKGFKRLSILLDITRTKGIARSMMNIRQEILSLAMMRIIS